MRNELCFVMASFEDEHQVLHAGPARGFVTLEIKSCRMNQARVAAFVTLLRKDRDTDD
jgi:hypothetical protein